MDTKQIMKRCVIAGDADIRNYAFIRKKLPEDDYFVICDSGLKYMDSLQVKLSLIVGDFGLCENPHIDAESEQLHQ